MIKQVTIIFVLACSSCFDLSGQAAPPVAPQLPAAEQLVSQFFPAELADPSDATDNYSCFGVYSKAADGSPLTIFAVYPEVNAGIRGEVVVIQRSASGQFTATKVSPDGYDLRGSSCEVDFKDVDGNGQSEVLVSLQGAAASVDADFLFQWNGSALTSIGPILQKNTGVRPNFVNAWFANLFNDGTLAVVSLDDPSPDEGAPLPSSIYRLTNGQYAFSTHSAFTLSAKPTIDNGSQSWDFYLKPESLGPFVLRVGNGNIDGTGRVTGAGIVVNGLTVLTSGDVNQGVGIVTVPLTNIVPGKNTLSVQLQGAKDSEIWFAVEDHTP